MMKRRMALLITAGMMMTAVPASAAAGVTITGTVKTGSTLRVNGGSTYVTQPFVTLATDAGADVGPGIRELGGDLASVGLSTTVDGDVKLRFTTHAMPPVALGSPALAYSWTFCIDAATCYELRMQRFTYGTDNGLPTAGDSALYRCATPACASSGLTAVPTGWIPIFYDGTGFTATVSAGVSLAPGAVITGVDPDGSGAATSGLGQADPPTYQRGTGDGIATLAPYTVAKRQVSVAIGAPGQDPAGLEYPVTVGPNGAGDWTATIDVAGLAGPHTVYARACLGQGNCAYTSAPVVL